MNTNHKKFQLSAEIDLLFDNKQLDILKYLAILFQLKKIFGRRRISLDELLFYYSAFYIETNETTLPLIYKYLRDEKSINEILLYLENLDFIQIHGDIFTSINKLKISIRKEGINEINSLDSESVGKYLENIYRTIKKYPEIEKPGKMEQILYKGDF